MMDQQAICDSSSQTGAEDADAGKKLTRARLCIVLAAVLWSTSGFFAKSTWFADWPTADRGLVLAFWRALFAGIVLLPAVRRPRFRPALVPMPLCFAAMNVTYLGAMTLTTAANAIWLQSTAPFWVLLFGAFFLAERFDRRNRLPLLLAFVGIAIILYFELQGQAQAGVVRGLMAGACYAGVVIFLRRLNGEDSAWLVAINHLVAAGLMFPFMLRLGLWPSPMQLGILAGFGTLQMAIPYLLFAHGLRRVTGPEATAIGLLEPILLPCWVLLAWGERPAPWTLVGGGLILAGLIIRYASPLFGFRPRPRESIAQ